MSEISFLKNKPDESVVQFADSVYLEADRCGNAYPEKQIMEVFIDGLQAAVHSEIHMFRECELGAYFT